MSRAKSNCASQPLTSSAEDANDSALVRSPMDSLESQIWLCQTASYAKKPLNVQQHADLFSWICSKPPNHDFQHHRSWRNTAFLATFWRKTPGSGPRHHAELGYRPRMSDVMGCLGSAVNEPGGKSDWLVVS